MNALPPNSELRRVRSRSVFWVIALLMVVPFAGAQIVIKFDEPLLGPNLELQPNMANQSFDLFADNSGGTFETTGIRVEFMVGDGGPEVGGSIDGPAISGISVTSLGTFFSSNNTGEGGGGNNGGTTPQFFQRSTLTQPGTSLNLPNGRSKIATVTFDTTGFGPGTTVGYTFNPGPDFNGPTIFHTPTGDFTPGRVDGTLTVIPEPSHSAATASIVCLFWAVWKRQKSRNLD